MIHPAVVAAELRNTQSTLALIAEYLDHHDPADFDPDFLRHFVASSRNMLRLWGDLEQTVRGLVPA